jgi:hypothetical protein
MHERSLPSGTDGMEHTACTCWYNKEASFRFKGEITALARDLIKCSTLGERSSTWKQLSRRVYILLVLLAWSVNWQLVFCNVVHTGSAVGCFVAKWRANRPYVNGWYWVCMKFYRFTGYVEQKALLLRKLVLQEGGPPLQWVQFSYFVWKGNFMASSWQ